MVKKVLFAVIPALILSVILFLSAQFILGKRNEKGALQVTSAPDSKVYLNDQLIGQTPLCKCEVKDMLPTGEYMIRLVPITGEDAAFQEKITITKSVLTVVDRKFATGASSEGSVITLTPLKDKNTIELTVLSLPDKASVTLDTDKSGFTPFVIKDITESDHTLRLKKDGYIEKVVRIRTPKGYKLTAIVYLGIDIGSITPTPTASDSASITPVPTNTVTILQTPTGFLRVRADSSIAAAEITRVSPGEEYEVISEIEGWYEIKVDEQVSGWISAQYAEKK
ncbi:MAG TPA: PEGA domain-containing protein [Patescibacteria group bacterium]|nr:PEGA domain-containing protein [Patescibacteria group bacterium]